MKRINFRIPDRLKASLEELATEVQSQGTEASTSEIARFVMEEGLKAIKRGAEPSSADKGAKFERWVLAEVKEALGGLEIERLRPEQGKKNPDLLGAFFAYECKSGKRPSARGALEQCETSDRGGKDPIAVIQDDDGEPFVVLRWSVFKKILEVLAASLGVFEAFKTVKK